MRIVVVSAIAWAAPAFAGPAKYGWLPATELVPASKVELDGWIYERDDRGTLHERASVIGAAPVFGASESFELRLPFELTERSAVGEARAFRFTRFGAEGRYRFTPRDAALAPMLRFAFVRDVQIRTMLRTELELAVAYEQGALQVEGMAGVVGEFNVGGVHVEAHPGAGASVRVRDGLRLGGELYGEVSFDSVTSTWLALGPNLAWRIGTSWLSASLGIGVYGIGFAPRLDWGLAW